MTTTFHEIVTPRRHRATQTTRNPSKGTESMRNAYHLLLGLLLASVSSAAGLAQTTIDVGKITCEQLVLLQVADPDHLAIWLSGYYSGKRNTTTVDVQQLKENARKVRSYCLSKGKGTVMEAVEAVVAPTR
jgi:acid stress chaperone HdeB